METTIIILSVISAALALLCLYLILYVYLTNKMLESKDLIIMELQRHVDLEKQTSALKDVTNKFRAFADRLSATAGELCIKLNEADMPAHNFGNKPPIFTGKGVVPGK